MCDVPVDVHGGGDTVFGDVLVAVRARLAVHRVDAGDGNALLAQSDVAADRAEAGEEDVRRLKVEEVHKVDGSK